MSDEPEITLGEISLGPAAAPPVSPRTPASADPGRVLVVEGVLAQMDGHVGEDTSVEHGGVMVGEVDERSGTTVVTGSIRAANAVSEIASLTFTHATWDYINAVMERDFPDRRIVGWYHSHPHFGIFLSEHDKFIHRNFFAQPWQIAYVRDPLLDQRGMFAWVGGDVVELPGWRTASASPGTGRSAPEIPRPAPARRRRWPLLVLIGVVLAGVLAAMLAFVRDGGAGSVALTVDRGDEADRQGAPGTLITVARVKVEADAGGGEVRLEASDATGDRSEVPVEISPLGGGAGFLVLASPPVGTRPGEYGGTMQARVCPTQGECPPDAPASSEEPFQLTVAPVAGVAVPRPDRWVDDSEPGLLVLPDEALVYGVANAVETVAAAGAPGGQRLAQSPTGTGEDKLSQVGWPPDGVPVDLATVADAGEVDRHYGFSAPDRTRVEAVSAEAFRDQVGLDEAPAAGSRPVAVATVSPNGGVQQAVCRSGFTNRCSGSSGPAGFPRGTGAARRVSVLEIRQAMDEAASDASVVLVGWDLPVCGEVGNAARGAVADLFDVLELPVLAHPETLFVFTADAAANAACPPEQQTLGVHLGVTFDNAIAVSAREEVGVSNVVLGPRGAGDAVAVPAEDVAAAVAMTGVAIDRWPGGEGAAGAVAACIRSADDSGQLDLSDGC